ncbi:MAG: hypothetical protein J6C99_00765 [Lachnospiraceae bacterium]|nr:hypothetical protein [Lachnospiraceae bacterium]
MIIKCEKGKHYYNTDMHAACPFCMRLRETDATPWQTGNSFAEAMTETETMLETDRKNVGYHV